MRSLDLIVSCLAACLWPLVASSAMADEPQEPSEGERLFALQIHPLLIDKCLACHGADPSAIEGGLDLTSRQGMKNGGDSFEDEVLVPGDARSSWLYRTVLRSEPGYEMPPKEADQLSQQQQWAIRDWIDAGAPWPTEQRIAQIQEIFGDGEKVVVSEALYSEWQNRRYESSKLWAYRPLKTVEIPTDHHPIDWLLDQELDAANLTAAPDASARTMIRRLSFGLTGLPPTPDETETFESEYVDDPGQAVIAFADRLLDSPHYGEHFGQHWLDVARYADSAGFANDYSRPNAWRYRDYVVRAFNQDKSYDEFVSQQIAGDELDATDPENLIATGFLRMGPWEQTSMSVFKETRGQWLDDVTDSVGQTFLAHSMLCCKCHDHKFDPVPTRDYYAMMAVFSTTQFADRNARFLESENRKGFVESDRWVQEKVKAYEDQKKELQADMQRKRKQETGDAKVGDNGLDPGDEASLARMNKNISRHKIELDRTRPIAFSVYTGATIHKNNIAGRIPLAKNPWKNGEVEVDAIRNGGDVYAIGDPVAPGALSAAISLGQMEPVEFPAGKGARRKALAKWIVDPANPLTARVIVNRVWSWHFGRGIAGNPNNFGGTGGLPTHPELLDYLAGWFIDSGWSIKKLNRLIVSSKAYRRASRHPDSEAVQTRDPEGKLYAVFQPRRLTAEELRDSLLRVSGELNLAVGGIPCRPDINLEVAFQPRQIMGGTASVYEPDAKPEQRNRRTLYAERLRGVRDPFLEVFNQPGPDKSCELRETSTVAPQALTLLNSSEVFERAVAFAARLSNEKHGSRRDIIQRAFMLALSRVPTEDELNACLAHWQQSTNASATSNYTSHQYVDRIERTVMAEKTGQPYTFVEHMPTYREYQPDLQPTDLSPEELGLAHVCRVLLNMNEFTYLD